MERCEFPGKEADAGKSAALRDLVYGQEIRRKRFLFCSPTLTLFLLLVGMRCLLVGQTKKGEGIAGNPSDFRRRDTMPRPTSVIGTSPIES